MLKRLSLLLSVFLIIQTVSAQVTTSSMSGVVKSPTGEALVGATIVATHVPTGTVYRTQTRSGGRFDIQNMNPGGPYNLVVSYVGFQNQSRTDIFLTLGEISNQDFDMSAQNNELATVVVTGIRAGQKNGSETSIGRDKIANLPTVGRNLNDYVRFTPQVKITNNGGISIAGQNNRFNSFMIDGAVNNDVFGLSDQGTNGGRAGVPPISIDAIDQLVVQISPFDASLGNFTGGGINAITRSGTNNLTGSVYYYYRNEELAGKTPGDVAVRTKLADFTNKTFGFRVGGAIVKNKLFFFINAERQDDERPQPYTPVNRTDANGNITFHVADTVNKLINFLKSKYNYDPGGFLNNPDFVKRNNINTRFDWNVNANHKVTLSYRYNQAERINPGRSSNTAINFMNGAEVFPSTTNSGTFELNSRFTNKINNKFRATFTRVVDDRGVYGTPFPNVTINDAGNGQRITFGSEVASSANLLKQTIVNFYDVFRYNAGRHGLTAGFDIDVNSSYNLFINRNYGLYEYASLQAFFNDAGPRRYRRGYSLVDPGNKGGDENANSAANFDSYRLGFFLNDDIRVGDNFTMTLGLRADRFGFTTALPTDRFFNDSARKVVTQFYDLKGAYAGQMFDQKWVFSPRLGFKYNLPDEKITIRGGLGVFTGRTPLVWPGGMYQNTGITIGAVDTTSNAGLRIGGNPLPFRPDVNNQYTQADFGLAANLLTPQGDLNLIAKDFKLPSVFRTSLGFDKRFGNGWNLTLEGIYTKNLQEVDWINVNFAPPTLSTTGPDKRTIYSTNGSPQRLVYRPTSPTVAGRNPYSNIILIQNTSGEKGFSYNLTASIDKAFRGGWALNTSYTYGNSVVRNEGTSSVNTSNWQNMEAVNGRNFLTRSTSDYDLGHRITTFLSKRLEYANKRLATTVSLFYNGQSGNPYSYVLAGNQTIVGDNVTFNDLIYVPTTAELQQMVFLTNTVGSVTYTPAQQREALNQFIANDKYLSKRRGNFAERNGARLPFTHIIDLKLQQDFNVKVANRVYSIQLGYDMFNFTNFLNKDWGRQYFLNFDQFALYNFAGYQTGTTTPQYRYTPVQGKPGTISDGVNAFNSSRWTSQVSLRLNF